MPNRWHNYRDYINGGSATRRIRYDEDDYRVEIYKFNKPQKNYIASNTSDYTSKNGIKLVRGGFTTIQAKDISKNLTLTFSYTPTREGNHRFEFLYLNPHQTSDPLIPYDAQDVKSGGVVSVNGKIVEQYSDWKGKEVVHNRHLTYYKVSKSQVGKELKIKYEVNKVTNFIAFTVKHFDLYQGDRHNKDGHELTILKASFNETNELDVSTLSIDLMFWGEIDTSTGVKNGGLYDKTNPNGYVFDYRDEINFYITDNGGTEQQIFGGYVSSVTLDEDQTTLTLDCADRIIDLDHRYLISEIGMNYTSNDLSVYDKGTDLYKNYNNWKSPLGFLSEYSEVPLKMNYSSVDATLKKVDPIKIYFGKPNNKSKVQMYDKFKTHNMSATVKSNYVDVRNGNKSDEAQYLVLFDDVLAKQTNKIVLNNYPTLNIKYGMGEPKLEVKESSNTDLKVNVNLSVSTDVRKQALKIMGNETDLSKAPKKLFTWMRSNTNWVYYLNFQRSPSTVLAKGSGNCCDLARLLLTMLTALGYPQSYLHYVATSNHVYTKIKVNGSWMIVDPSTYRGWGNRWSGSGSFVRETTFPKNPYGG